MSDVFDVSGYKVLQLEFEELQSSNPNFSFGVEIFDEAGNFVKSAGFNGEFRQNENRTLNVNVEDLSGNVKLDVECVTFPYESWRNPDYSYCNKFTGTYDCLVTSVALGK